MKNTNNIILILFLILLSFTINSYSQNPAIKFRINVDYQSGDYIMRISIKNTGKDTVVFPLEPVFNPYEKAKGEDAKILLKKRMGINYYSIYAPVYFTKQYGSSNSLVTLLPSKEFNDSVNLKYLCPLFPGEYKIVLYYPVQIQNQQTDLQSDDCYFIVKKLPKKPVFN